MSRGIGISQSLYICLYVFLITLIFKNFFCMLKYFVLLINLPPTPRCHRTAGHHLDPTPFPSSKLFQMT